MGGSKAKRKIRVTRALELMSSGLTIGEISKMMIYEGYAASERTIWSDLNGVEAKEYLGELIRKQLADIAIEPDSNIRMKYRDKLLDKMMPSKIVQKVERKVVTYDVEGLLKRMAEKREMLEKNR